MKRSIAMAATFMVPALAFSTFLTVTAASNDFADGQGLFAQKNYKGAALKFESAMKTGPGDATVYYCALSHQMANNRARARQLYEYLNSSFPGSKYASMASSALKSLGDVGTASTSSASSTSSSGGYASRSAASGYSGPSQFTVPFKKGRFGDGRGGVYVDVLVNNHPMSFHLDTGAHGTVMGANQLDEIGMGRPAQGEKGFSGGVGERDKIPTWTQKLDLKVGNIYMRDFPVSVHDFYEGEPLLGRDFLREWDVSIDESSRQVTFSRKGLLASRPKLRGTIDIPFTNQGRHMIVEAAVNGKPYKFYFDTGADNVCFSMSDLKKLGLEDSLSGARQGYSQGVGGRTLTYSFPVDSLKMGPIVKENFTVSVVEQSVMDHPLMGQTFFGSYSYVIDEGAKVIHFKPAD